LSQNPTISDTQAEAGIIATLIFNSTFCLHSEQLKHNHFYNKESSCIYWAINQLIKQGVENIDSLNLTTMINSNEGMKNTFNKFGIDLDNYIHLSKNISRNSIEEYKILVNRVLALAFKRDLHKQLKKFDDMCLDINQDDINILSGEIYGTINKLNEQYVLNDDIKLIGEVIDDIWNEIEERSYKGVVGIKPKIELLSNYFTYENGELVLLQARMKQGKSAYMLNEALYQLKQGYFVAYFDTEMPSRQFVERALAHLTGVEVRKIKNGSYSSTDADLLKEALIWFKKQKFVHLYKPQWTAETIYATAKILQYKMGLNFLIFDYIKNNSGNASEVANKLGEQIDYLKNFVAGNMNIPVLAAAQLGRNGEVADSDKLDRYTSVTVKWTKKNKDEEIGDWKKVGNFKLNVKYNRLGELMDDDEWIDVVFNGNTMDIHQAPVQHTPEDYNL
jgi:replicative DNA helicase